MPEGVDYSFANPDPVCLARGGKTFAVRYIGTPTSGKNLEVPEAQALRDAGIDIVAVYQTSTSFMISSRDRGVTAATSAVNDARKYGYPTNRPIYFALDTDPSSLSAASWEAVQQFLIGVANVIGRPRVGVYAGYAGIERLVPTYAAFGWQTYAWSGGRVSGKAHLLQYRNGVSLCGGAVDLCRSLKADFGQWNAVTKGDAMTPEQERHFDDRLDTIQTKVETTFNQVNIRTGALSNKLNALDAVIDALSVDVRDPEIEFDVDAFAEAVSDRLPLDLAAQVVQVLTVRLAD